MRCDSSFLSEPVANLLDEFRVSALPSGGVVDGAIRLYRETEVVRRLPQTAIHLSEPGDLTDIYQRDEIYWIIDDRWGLAEVNVLKGTWRSWIVPQPTLDPWCCADLAVLWPLAMLLRGRGLALVPAASVVRGECGVLMLGWHEIEPELSELIRAGYRIVGQRWTALREEAGQIAMLYLPGKVERSRTSQVASAGLNAHRAWIDLTTEFCGAAQNKAPCSMVLLLERGRRPVTRLAPLPRSNALVAIRRAWPTLQVNVHRRLGHLHARLARLCRCYDVRLSRDPRDILRLLDDARYNRTHAVRPIMSVEPAVKRIVA